jgi:methyltransferase
MFFCLLLMLALQRGAELLLAGSNTAQLRRQGAVELGAGHYPVMVCLHAAWFGAMLWERAHGVLSASASLAMLGWAMLLWGQGLRWWTITTLGRRWTTRILVLPGAPLVDNGPFRLLSHPNYLGVWLEIVGVPLIGGCWRTALMIGLLHTAFLVFRIGFENRALREHGCLPPSGANP